MRGWRRGDASTERGARDGSPAMPLLRTTGWAATARLRFTRANHRPIVGARGRRRRNPRAVGRGVLRARRDALAEGGAQPRGRLVPSSPVVPRARSAQWVWLLGLAAQIVGVVLQAAALDRGRVSIIQPLLVTTVIWALPLGYFLTHQTVGRREILGAAIIVVGLVGFASFGDPAAGIDDAPGADWAIAVIVIGLACVALLLFANRGSLSMSAAVARDGRGDALRALGDADEARRREPARRRPRRRDRRAGSSGSGPPRASSASCSSSSRSRPASSSRRWRPCRSPTP